MKRIVATLVLICTCHASFADTSGDWTYTVSNNQATITGYTGAGRALTIPDSLNGFPVKNIGQSAFYYNTRTLESITIPDGLISIGSHAFYGCGRLSSVSIPKSVTNIGERAFGGTVSLLSITLDSDNLSYSTSDGVLYNKGLSILLACPGGKSGTFVISSSVTRIEDGAFFGCYFLEKIIIPNSVTSIGSLAIYSCNNLTTLVLPDSVTAIGEDAFRENSSLNFIILSDNLARFAKSHGNFFDSDITIISRSMLNALANDDLFIELVANKIKGTFGTYGLATKGDLSELATHSELTLLATKSEITTAINEGKASGIASVTASPNTWSLFTSSQIQNMAIGDLVLTREVNGNFVLNYDIEQSSDLANWTVYSANTQIVKLPADKAFVRIKAKQ